MKKLLLMTVALVALGSSVAMADSMNLAWGVCRTAANHGTASTNNFAPTVPCEDPGNAWTTRRIVASFKNTTPMTAWGGTTVRIDMLVGVTPIPDFWNVGAGGCRDGALSGPTVAINPSPTTNCINPYILVAPDPGGQTNLESIQINAAGSRIRYEADHVRNTVQVDLPVPASPGGYLANNLALTSDFNDGCLGCDQPVCLVLNQVDYFSLTEKRSITTPELQAHTTWNGGAVPGTCPQATPTRSATWGAVKALYR